MTVFGSFDELRLVNTGFFTKALKIIALKN
jgi:hypothetical protein